MAQSHYVKLLEAGVPLKRLWYLIQRIIHLKEAVRCALITTSRYLLYRWMDVWPVRNLSRLLCLNHEVCALYYCPRTGCPAAMAWEVPPVS
jgi:hypothetical protein